MIKACAAFIEGCGFHYASHDARRRQLLSRC